MKNIKLIIFDLDGTLIDAYGAIASSLNYVLARFGLKTQSKHTVRRLVGWGDINLLKPYVAKKDLKRALSLYRADHKITLLKQSYLYPGVRKLLSSLKAQDYRLAVASNRPSKFSRILLKHLKILDYFDFVLCADQAAFPKPHPDMLRKIIKRFALKKSEALYVGDMVIDALAGRRGAVKTIIVTSGSSSKTQIKAVKPFKIISAISNLPAIVLDSPINR